MARNIKIKIDVDSDSVEFASDSTLTLTEKVRFLRKELQRVPEGTAEWNTLNKAFNENKDALDRVNIKSRELFGTLSALPGPLGSVAGGLDRNIDLLKTFSSIKLEDLKKGLLAVVGDIKEIGTTFLKVTGIQKLYAITTVAVSKALQFVGIEATVASVGVRAFSAALIGTGIGAIVVGLGFLINAFMNTGDEADTAAIKVGKLNAEIANTDRVSKLRNEEEIARAKARGASDTELFNIKQKQTQKELADARQKYREAEVQMIGAEVLNGKDSKGYIDAQKLKSEAAIKIDQLKSKLLVQSLDQETNVNKKLAEENKKASDESTKNVEKRAGDIKELEEAEHAALLSLMSNKEKELTEVDDKYKKLIDKEKAYGRDTTLLVSARENEKKTIREKYAQEELDYIDKALAASGDLQEKARQKDLNDAATAYKKIFDQKVLAGEETTNIDKAYAQQQLDINAKHDQAILKTKQDFYNIVASIEIAAIANKKDRDLAEAQKDYDQALTDLTTNKEFLALEATDYEAALAIKEALLRGYNVKTAEIIQTAFEDEKSKAAKHTSDQLQLLSIQGESLIRGTKAYNNNKREILKVSMEQELNAVKVSEAATTEEKERAEAARTAITAKYAQLRKDSALQEGIYVAQQISAGLNAAKGVADAILAVNENKMNEELKLAGADEAKKEEIKKKYFEKNKKTQIALAYINTFQSAVSAFASMASIPVVGPVLGAIAAAAAIVAGLANVAKIKASTYEGSNAGGGASAAAAPKMTMAVPEQPKAPTQEKSTVSAEGGIGSIINKSSNKVEPNIQFNKNPNIAIDPKIKVNSSPNIGISPNIAIDPNLQFNKNPNIAIDPNFVMNKVAATPNIGSAVSNTTVQAKATGNAVGDAVSKRETPIQTYVVGTQVSSQQELDRRVSLAAKMGG